MDDLKNGVYVVSVPIGNYMDISLHALQILQKCDIILCEDTRKTNLLLVHHNINRGKLLIYNNYTRSSKTDHFLKEAKVKSVALVSDAGTPLICDPGHSIVNLANNYNVNITIVAGPCALISACTLCGFSMINTVFLGFFTKKIQLNTQYINAIYLPPHDTQAFITALQRYSKSHNIKITIAKDVTKKYQKVIAFDNLSLAESYCKKNVIKGEIVAFVEFISRKEIIDYKIQMLIDEYPELEQMKTKKLASFLQKYFLHNSSAKEIYTILCSKNNQKI